MWNVIATVMRAAWPVLVEIIPMIVAWLLRKKDKVEEKKQKIRKAQANEREDAEHLIERKSDDASRKAMAEARVIEFLLRERRVRGKGTKPAE